MQLLNGTQVVLAVLHDILNQASAPHLHYCPAPPTDALHEGSPWPQELFLCFRSHLSTSSFSTKLPKRTFKTNQLIPLKRFSLSSGFQFLLELHLNLCPSLFKIFATLTSWSLNTLHLNHIRLFFLTLNLFPPSYFVFHFPRWLFSEIGA